LNGTPESKNTGKRKGDEWLNYLKELGERGWELVETMTLYLNQDPSKITFLFKRPKAEEHPTAQATESSAQNTSQGTPLTWPIN
jgi:hypothetical protein